MHLNLSIPKIVNRKCFTLSLLIVKRQTGKLHVQIFKLFGLPRPGIEPDFTVSETNAVSTKPLIVKISGSQPFLGPEPNFKPPS